MSRKVLCPKCEGQLDKDRQEICDLCWGDEKVAPSASRQFLEVEEVRKQLRDRKFTDSSRKASKERFPNVPAPYLKMEDYDV
jgi:hypothetical protein